MRHVNHLKTARGDPAYRPRSHRNLRRHARGHLSPRCPPRPEIRRLARTRNRRVDWVARRRARPQASPPRPTSNRLNAKRRPIWAALAFTGLHKTGSGEMRVCSTLAPAAASKEGAIHTMTTTQTKDSQSVSATQGGLRVHFDRATALLEQMAALRADIAEWRSQARADGLDPRALLKLAREELRDAEQR